MTPQKRISLESDIQDRYFDEFEIVVLENWMGNYLGIGGISDWEKVPADIGFSVLLR